MNTTRSHSLRQSLAISASVVLLTACANDAPVAPARQAATEARLATGQRTAASDVIATLQRVTGRYHSLKAAADDGFVLLHSCEVRGDEGPVGTVYVHFGRLLDGRIDPELPDALIYEPHQDGLKLVGVELAVLNAGQDPPQFLGATFQSEDEFGVYALHAWVWRENPEGIFAETNPRVSCGEE